MHERYMGFCHRKPVYPAPPTTPDGNTAGPNTTTQPESMPVVWGTKEWEEEKDRMWAVGRQAGDTVSLSFCRLYVMAHILYITDV